MEQKEEVGNGNNLVFAVNGERFELSSVHPSTTLIEFLRTRTRFKSVKLGCGEGGCGACVVLLSKYNPVLDQVEDCSISSCLTLVCSLNQCSITTSEGLGNSKDGFHAIQKRFTGFNASQCGFCTPGMCISLFAELVNARKSNRKEIREGFSKLTVCEAEKAIAGNLCRCTGYRPIADACKSFAGDVDMEDLGLNSFWTKGEVDEVKLKRLPSYINNDPICTFPEFLKNEIKNAMILDPRKFCWENPTTVEELQNSLKHHEANNGTSVKLVVGNTGVGYYKEVEDYDTYINIRCVQELSIIREDESGIEIGAAVTISKAIDALKVINNIQCSSQAASVLEKIANHMEKVATGFIRNSASVGGNIVMAQRKQFPSDITTILLAVDTMVEILNGQQREKFSLEEFLERPPMESNSVLLCVNIPFSRSTTNIASLTNTMFLFETYRAAPRPLGNALAHLNAAFWAEVSPCKTVDGIKVLNCRLAFGAYGDKHAIRAKNVEEFLTGKVLSDCVLHEAIILLGDIIVPNEGTPSAAYRSSLAVSFLFRFFSPLIETKTKHHNCSLNGYKSRLSFEDSSIKESCEQLDQVKSLNLLSSAQQVIEHGKEYNPIGEPITKSGASLQGSGEAVFVDDIPSPENCVYGAFIYSTKPLARIKSIDLKPKILPHRRSALITSKDIPEGAENIGSMTIFGPEPLFADEITHCAGQRVAVVVADTQKQADKEANLAVIDYDTENLELPILTVEEAVERSSFFEVPAVFYPRQVGDISKGMAEAEHKIISSEIRLGSQYYFYLETQTALAVPDEDNCIVVYSSTQCPEYTHATIARCLGIPEHNVRVITRRVGGGFGGKSIKAMPVATACALAAQRLRCPVRMYLNRKTDMIMAGGRHPMKVTYSVGFKSNGKITALQLEILFNAGMSADISPIMPHNIVGPLKKYDWGSLAFDMKVCKTNLPSRSAMRAPGEVQGSYIAEAIIEHVASTLSMEVDSVRKINLHTENSLKLFYDVSAGEPHEYTLPSIWDKLEISSSLNQRTEIIKQFNKCSTWCKRGISRIPVVHEVIVRPTPGKVSILSDGSVVVEVGGIELGQGLWTKVKQMAAYSLSLINCTGTESLLEKVRVVQADTLSMIQGGFTSGSTTSESSCEAVRLCCNILVERLTSVKDRCQKQMGSIKWEMLISQAYSEYVNLSASSFYAPEFTSMKYLNYGVAVSEVEVNILTGETSILRTDVIYDCGQSLNPAVDLGQIEGAFVQGIGFFMLEEYNTNSDGLVISDSTWTYKIPTVDTIPKQFNVEILNSGHHQKRVLSSKASGEPPLLLAASVHCATRAAINEARKQLISWSSSEDGYDQTFQLRVPATMAVVKELCGLDSVEKYLQWKIAKKESI